MNNTVLTIHLVKLFQICTYSADLYLGFANNVWATFEMLQNVFILNNIVILVMFIHAYEYVFTPNSKANAQCIVAVQLSSHLEKCHTLES